MRENKQHIQYLADQKYWCLPEETRRTRKKMLIIYWELDISLQAEMQNLNIIYIYDYFLIFLKNGKICPANVNKKRRSVLTLCLYEQVNFLASYVFRQYSTLKMTFFQHYLR